MSAVRSIAEHGAVVRLADLLAGPSRLADLGFGIPVGEALRTSALTAALGRSLDLPDDDVRAGLYTAGRWSLDRRHVENATAG